MQRRVFNRLAGASLLAYPFAAKTAFGQSADASSLNSTLTPTGAERAGNQAGTIPAWTGGMTEIPAGFSWDPAHSLPPDFFAADAMLYKVDASNMAQYAHQLSIGIQTLMKKKGFYIKVYPTHRTHALPRWMYDNIALNVTRARPQGGEYRLGFTGAVGGYPFPIPSSDPLQAGAQIAWNNLMRWYGSDLKQTTCAYTNANGVPVLTEGARIYYRSLFNRPDVTPENYKGFFYNDAVQEFAPGTSAGFQACGQYSNDPTVFTDMSWEVLPGQGRVRKTPNLQYDTPSSYTDGIINYDEYFGFSSPLDRFDFRLIGKQEMLIPYNNNKVFSGAGAALHTPNFFDPEYVRWELHRVWVVDATLHPGKRNVIPHRRLHFSEDSWQCAVVDEWDPSGNLERVHYTMNANFPNLPGTIWMDSILYNLQTGQYVSTGGSFGDKPYNEPWSFAPQPDSVFEPQAMAAAASY